MFISILCSFTRTIKLNAYTYPTVSFTLANTYLRTLVTRLSEIWLSLSKQVKLCQQVKLIEYWT